MIGARFGNPHTRQRSFPAPAKSQDRDDAQDHPHHAQTRTDITREGECDRRGHSPADQSKDRGSGQRICRQDCPSAIPLPIKAGPWPPSPNPSAGPAGPSTGAEAKAKPAPMNDRKPPAKENPAPTQVQVPGPARKPHHGDTTVQKSWPVGSMLLAGLSPA